LGFHSWLLEGVEMATKTGENQVDTVGNRISGIPYRSRTCTLGNTKTVSGEENRLPLDLFQ